MTTLSCSAALVREFVSHLPREDRLLVMLRYADDLQVEEIAAVLSQPIDGIRRRLDDLDDRARRLIGRSFSAAASAPVPVPAAPHEL